MNTATVAGQQAALTPFITAVSKAAVGAWKALFATPPVTVEPCLAPVADHDELAIRQREVERSEAHALAMSWVI